MKLENGNSKKYKVIYADPPWEFKGSVLKNKYEGRKHYHDSRVQTIYDTMSDSELINFRINDFADEDCILFMWATVPKLPFAFTLLESWGFQYKTMLTWKKEYHRRNGGFGQGTYFMIQTEHLLFATKGKVKQFFSGEPNYIVAETRGHSVKPDVFRKLIERVTNNIKPRIELFARTQIYDWDVFGNDSKINDLQPLEVFSK